MVDPVERFFPPLRDWFQRKFPHGLTRIQQQALPLTQANRDVLILAPTGSGKTLSAFLSVLSNLGARAAAEGLPNAACCVYVSPLRSLDRDIHRNLTGPLEAINVTLPEKRRIRMEVRTGDTENSQRAQMQRNRPHLLLTTVESLSALLSQVGWRDGLQVQTVVVDEIHAFAESKRGSLMSLALERLAERATRGESPAKLQRIGLSATAHPVESIATLLCGRERRQEMAVVEDVASKSYSLEIAVPSPDEPQLPPAGYNAFRVATVVQKLVEPVDCSLIFTTTRSASERIGLALKVLMESEEERIEVHHGSIERDTRLEIERRLAAGDLKAVACSSSLELGVDFQAVDHVLMIGTPRGVSRTLQRMGRSGHRHDGIARGTLVPLNTLEMIEAIALRQAVKMGKLDRIKPPRAPLDVLAQVLLGMSVEREWNMDEAFQLAKRAGPYDSLTRDHFDLVIEYLLGGGRVLGPYGTYGKIALKGDNFVVASKKAAREYYMNIGTISDAVAIKVVSEKMRPLGQVEEGFVASLRPNEAFVIQGRPVVISKMHGNVAQVRPASGERVTTPRWGNEKIPMTAQLAQEELRLRQAMRHAVEAGGLEEVRRVLQEDWDADEKVADNVVRFLKRQLRAAPVPVDNPMQIEFVPEFRAMVMQFHVLAGRAVNRSLAWVVAHRLDPQGSVIANFDDHSFMLSIDAKKTPDEAKLRAAFQPEGFLEDLLHIVSTTESIGYGFRRVAETGQLLPRRTTKGRVSSKSLTWNGSLLYKTLLTYEPGHPLVQEAVREVIEDQLDGERARDEAARIFETPWEMFRHPRPSPFALPLFAAFNREILMAQDPEKALDELVEGLLDGWSENTLHVAS
jgi:ATP-dependent helicase Lhr and Lhr-like helicase